jgi:hypothetical protein
MRIGIVRLLVVGLLVSACGSLENVLSDPAPCERITPPPSASVEHSASQEISVGDQQLMVLHPLTDIPVYSGPDKGALVLDGHAIVCNVYILVPDRNGAVTGEKRSHVAQVYTAADGHLVALWNRSGWIENKRFKKWR